MSDNYPTLHSDSYKSSEDTSIAVRRSYQAPYLADLDAVKRTTGKTFPQLTEFTVTSNSGPSS